MAPMAHYMSITSAVSLVPCDQRRRIGQAQTGLAAGGQRSERMGAAVPGIDRVEELYTY